jgi:nicotinamide-nucleotide amidase
MDRMTTPLTSAEVIAVGSELLGTAKLDTNSLFIAGQLGRLGIELKAKSVVGDDRERLADVLRNALTRADLVILTGGLGPTDDDLTREAVADVLGLELVEDPAITARIRQRFERRGMSMPEVNRRQAMVHRGARVLPNPNGSAPGILIETNGRMVVLLPGPPRELQPMLSALCADGGAIAERAGRERLFTASIFTASASRSAGPVPRRAIPARWR